MTALTCLRGRAGRSRLQLSEVVTEPCALCPPPAPRPDSGLPSYEAAVMLRDTKL
ncbi:hypothetical protein JYU34_014620 [Plutella xylostella]|uniref:Uncharacterized protein n=1 Tax=Plutella xylostella TaxID=51655 RepID=A0ABQ7Q8T9_PLUXY|nr:hypothetical protein JYU34_014620 [Plutella xylostella]